jgi:hypothetical protein
MFNTTLTNEFLIGHRTFGWDIPQIRKLMLDAVNVTLLPEHERQAMHNAFEEEFGNLLQS